VRRAGLVALVAAVACGAGAAEAAGADVTFHVGGLALGDVTVGGLRRSLDGGALFGFRLAHGFVPLFGLEHTLSFSPSFARPEGLSGSGDTRGFVYSSNLIVNAPFRRTVPYAPAGVLLRLGP
jgi:hypothetical protein